VVLVTLVQGSIYAEVSPGEKRVAIVDAEGRLVELFVERIDRPEEEGGIHLGRVTRVERSLNGAFVALGETADGFLRGAKGLHEGQSVLVQVTRDASGGKGPTLTDKPSIVGRYLALTPSRSGTTFSARLGNGRRRAELEALADRLRSIACPTDEGLAVRGAAAFASDEEMAEEATRLRGDWARLRELSEQSKAPSVLAPAPGLIARVLRDRERGAVIIDDPQAFRDAERLVRERMPDRRGRLQRHNDQAPLFEALGLADEIDGICDRIVHLKGGVRLTIDPVEALTAIDVDSGAGGRRASEDAILRTNLAVLPEIARLVRLRNISGLIVVDFISMQRKATRAQFMQSARRAFRSDPMQVDVMGMTAAGLLELTRRRGAPPLHDILMGPATAAPTADTAACAILRAALRLTGPGHPVVRATPPVIAALGGALATARAEVDRRLGQPLLLQSDPAQRDWDVTMERG
jgi:ribonuclease G